MKAIGFDFDHTLGFDNKLERVAFLGLLDAPGPVASEIVRIDALLAQQRGGAFPIDEAVSRFVHERGVRDAQRYIERYKRRCLDLVDAFVIPEYGARALCRELRERGIAHALLTNGWSPLQERKAAAVGFTGPVLVSSELGMQKPDAGAFRELVTVLGCDAAQTAFVGDSPESDVAGALRAGLQGIWYDTEGIAYPADLPAPSQVIHSLAELLPLL